MEQRTSSPLELGPVIAERTFTLYKGDGTRVPVTVRLGAPFVGGSFEPPAYPEYRCAVQIVGIGDERVAAPWGEDPFVALQYAIDFIGERLDELTRRESLQIRFRSDRTGWIWRYPPH